jgi:hypothetical protein
MTGPNIACTSCGSELAIPRKDGPPLCLDCDPDLDRRAADLWRKENPDESVFNATWEIKLKYALRVLSEAEIHAAREIIAGFILWHDPAYKPSPSESLAKLLDEAKRFMNPA